MYSGTGHRRKDLLGGAPRQRSKSRDVSAVPSSCIWIFVLVVLAIPGVSYYFLHSRLVERYVALERAFHAEREQVTQLKTQVADLSKIKDSLSKAVQALKELEKPKVGESLRPRISSSEPIYAPKFEKVVPKAIRGSAECATALEPFFGSTPDLYSSGVFKDRTHGVFVDVGAGDGVFQSKTHFYEQHLCWTGITVEPTPYEYEKLKTQRPKSTAVMGAVCASDGPKGMTDVSKDRKWTGWSGFPETFSTEHHQMIANAVAHEGFTKETITVECYTMKKLLAQSSLKQVDLLTIAVEGHEFQVLRSIDFAAVNIDVIEVECPTNSPDQSGISMLLEEKGYAPGYRLWDNHRDLIFKKKNA